MKKFISLFICIFAVTLLLQTVLAEENLNNKITSVIKGNVSIKNSNGNPEDAVITCNGVSVSPYRNGNYDMSIQYYKKDEVKQFEITASLKGYDTLKATWSPQDKKPVNFVFSNKNKEKSEILTATIKGNAIFEDKALHKGITITCGDISTKTDVDGDYIMKINYIKSENKEFLVKASFDGYRTQEINWIPGNVTDINFVLKNGVAIEKSDAVITGKVTINGNDSPDKVTINYNGFSAKPDSDGNYSMNVKYSKDENGNSFYVTSSLIGYKTQKLNWNPENNKDINFTMEKIKSSGDVTLSGYIETNSGSPIENVKLYFGNIETMTDKNGFYEIKLQKGSTGTLKPLKFGFNFNPSAVDIKGIKENKSDINFKSIETDYVNNTNLNDNKINIDFSTSDDNYKKANLKINSSIYNGISTCSITKDFLEKILNVSEGKDTIVISHNLTETDKINNYKFEISKDIINNLKNTTNLDILLSSPIGEILITNEDLNKFSSSVNNNAIIAINNKGSNILEIKILDGAVKVNNTENLKVFLPYTKEMNINNLSIFTTYGDIKSEIKYITVNKLKNTIEFNINGNTIIELSEKTNNINSANNISLASSFRFNNFINIENNWAKDSIKYIFEKGFFSDIENKELDPDEPITRAMVSSIFYNIEKKPKAKKISFSDVKENDYFYDAVSWAVENKIANDIGNNSFAPNQFITIERFADMIYKYAKSKNIDVSDIEEISIKNFNDYSQISDWAISPISYCLNSGIIFSENADSLRPKDNITIAEASFIIQQFLENNKL